MKMIATTVMLGCMAMAAGGVSAQDTMKKDTPAATGAMTMQECKDYMAMAKKAGKKDAATVKKEAACTEMMKKPPADEAKKQ